MSDVLGGAESKATVYVIDDEKPVATLMEAILLEAGYEVYLSYTGEQALEEIDGGGLEVDVFLVDVVLPEISGPDLAQELLKRSPNAKILFTSGHGEGAAAALRKSNPDATFLAKPFDPDSLADAVAAALA